MPLILPEGMENKWLIPIEDDIDIKAIQELIHSYPGEELEAYTVDRLRGKEYRGNIPEISQQVQYPELTK